MAKVAKVFNVRNIAPKDKIPIFSFIEIIKIKGRNKLQKWVAIY